MSSLNTRLAHRATGFALFAIFLLLWAALTKAYSQSWQVQSRMATVQTLVEQGTFVIDRTVFNNTGDKIFVNGHFYSDKTPILSVAAAGAYAVLRNVFGLALDPEFCLPDDDPLACRAFGDGEPHLTAMYWLTLILIGVPSALLVALFWRELIKRGVGGLAATGLAVLLGIASPIAPYSIVFAGHIPAALCLFMGFILLTRPATRTGLFWAGLWIGLAANIDLLLTLLVVAFGIWVFAARRSFIAPFVVGVVIPYALTSAINYAAVGSIIPMYLDPRAYDFPGTVLHTTPGGTDGFYSLEFGLRYAYDMFVGRRGIFAFTPLLIYALAGAWIAVRNRDALRGLTLALLAGSLAFTAYLIVRTDNFGGEAWGTRWFAPIVPLMWLYLPFVFEKPRSRAWRLILAVAVLISLWTIPNGLHDPWQTVRPVLRLETTAIDYPE
jgi:hypothetical protein